MSFTSFDAGLTHLPLISPKVAFRKFEMSEKPTIKFFVRTPTSRPNYWAVAEFLWHEGTPIDIDSDGDCSFPDDREWTELTITRRPNYDERVDVDPIVAAPLTLEVRSKQPELAIRTAYYLARCTGGTVSESPDSEFMNWRTLETRLGDFDYESRFLRT